MPDMWNRCDECGRLIAYADFVDGRAFRKLLEPDSDLGVEKYETLCARHYAIEHRSAQTVKTEPS